MDLLRSWRKADEIKKANVFVYGMADIVDPVSSHRSSYSDPQHSVMVKDARPPPQFDK